MLFQHMVPWHIEYFKLKEVKKTAEAEVNSGLLLPYSSSLKQVVKLPGGR